MMLGLPAITLALSIAFCQAARLVDFQVAQPPPVPRNAKQCTTQILQRDFAFSFGSPEVVQYIPPTDCGEPGSWAGVTLNLTVTSNGTQFDRLGIFTFHNVEIWRTSTPEPTRGDGIIWTYVKDLTRYTPLFAEPGTFVFQLDNLIQTGLDGVYSTVVHATFFESSDENPPAPKSDLILTLGAISSNNSADVSVPPSFSSNVTVPQNTVQLFAELYASGNGNEEFWYFNVPNQFLNDVPGSLGAGPFREVRLLVDGQVAGTAFPYATIFTGGIIPTAWRPITSYGALDLPTYFLDLTPFIPVLVDGQAHNFTLDIASAEDDHLTLQNWFLSGLLQVVTDKSGKATTGKIVSYSAQPFSVTNTTGNVASNGDVNFTVDATRSLRIESEITSGSGETTHVVFSQELQFSNTQVYANNFNIQNVFQTATGSVSSTHNGQQVVSDDYSFPLNINFTSLNPSGSQFKAIFDHSYDRVLAPAPFILASTIHERQIATGFFTETAVGNTGNGTSNNTLDYVDAKGNTFTWDVNASLNNITLNRQSGNLAPSPNLVHLPSFQQNFNGSGVARLPHGGKLTKNGRN